MAPSTLERFFASLPSELLEECHSLLKRLKPYTQEVYAVGGAVRDFLLAKPLKDLDLEIHGIAPQTFHALMQKLGALGVGKSFFVYKLGNLDLSLPRCERKVADGHRGFSVTLAKTAKEAASRRDFTINSLMLNLYTGEILDFFGGIQAIEERKISITSLATFAEDNLRILRAARFSAQLGFRIDSKDLPLMQNLTLDHLSGERIYEELHKLLLSPDWILGFESLALLGLDQKLFGHTFTPALFVALKALKERFCDLSLLDSQSRALLPLYLLWLTRAMSREEILAPLKSMPKRLQKAFRTQKRVARIPRDRFLVGLAFREPLSHWLGCCDPLLKAKAEQLGILHRPFAPTTAPTDLLREGLRGEALGRVWKNRRRKEVLTLFK